MEALTHNIVTEILPEQVLAQSAALSYVEGGWPLVRLILLVLLEF